jgi:hypothetical protein
MKSIIQELEELQTPDIELHEKKLKYVERLLIGLTLHKNAPTDLLHNWVELSKVIESFRIKNPSTDLTVYDNALASMRSAIMYMEDVGEVYRRNEYLESMSVTQSNMMNQMQQQLNEYTAIESMLCNGSLLYKVKSVLKKMKP